MMGCRSESSRAYTAGITLVETLLTIALISVGFTVLLEAFAHTARWQATADERKVAVELAIVRLNEIRFARTPGKDEEGRFDPPFQEWTWRTVVEPFEDTTFQKISLFVAKDATSHRQFHLTALIREEGPK